MPYGLAGADWFVDPYEFAVARWLAVGRSSVWLLPDATDAAGAEDDDAGYGTVALVPKSTVSADALDVVKTSVAS